MFFIVSTGRSGTTTLADILSSVPGCVCLHEPEPAFILESSGYRYGDVTAEEIGDVLKRTRKPQLNGSIYCESNQTLSLIMPVLRKTFPKARFIWLLRNGLDVVASTMQKQWYSGFSENHTRYDQCTPTQKAWINGRIRGDLCGDMSLTEWKHLVRFGKCCWYWRYVNRLIAHDLRTISLDDYYLLRLESLIKQLPSLLAWMDLETAVTPTIVQQNSAKRPPYHWSKWTQPERQIFEYWCGDLMDNFYPSWRDSKRNWEGVPYQTPLVRNQLSYLVTGIKNFVRKYR